MTLDVNCRLMTLPFSIRPFVVHNSDMSYTIILNDRLTYEQHLICYAHEMAHILNNDFDKKTDINIVELQAHQ